MIMQQIQYITLTKTTAEEMANTCSHGLVSHPRSMEKKCKENEINHAIEEFYKYILRTVLLQIRVRNTKGCRHPLPLIECW